MSLNDKASSERVHIGFFGMRNCGKSSLVNAVTGQKLSVVSKIKGTTTDPVRKSMELLPLGPVTIIDTPGIDDEGELGELRVQRTRQVLHQVDVAVLVTDGTRDLLPQELELLQILQEKKVCTVIAYNKCDLSKKNCRKSEAPGGHEKSDDRSPRAHFPGTQTIRVSALKNIHIYELKELIARAAREQENQKHLVADLISPGDLIVLVVPIDSAAPKGRLILPQQQTIRDILERGAVSVVTRESELKQTLASLNQKPRMVITDSQAFGRVSADTPEDILLTSFSILFARYKGSLARAVAGAARLDHLQDGDTILISEGCTHYRQCDDIGTVKLPAWIRAYSGRDLKFAFTSGRDFPEDLSGYALIVHCGGCMLNEREMQYRSGYAAECGAAMTNYGVAIAQMHGILRRSLGPFPEIRQLLDHGQ